MMAHELTIEGMTCGHCVSSVQRALASVPGVTKAEVTLDSAKLGHAQVEGEVERDALVRVVEAEEYRVVR